MHWHDDLPTMTPALSRLDWKADSFARTAAIVGGFGSLALLGLAVGSWWLWLVLWPVMGVLLSGAFGGMHRASHGAFWPGRRMNEAVGRLWALMLLINFSWFRAAHLRHHRFAAGPEDTEPPLRIGSRFDYVTALVTCNFLVHLLPKSLRLAGPGGGPDWLSARERKAARFDALLLLAWMGAVGAGLFLWPWEVLAIYGCPLAVALLCDAVFSIPEHFGCAASGSPNAASRTVLTAPWLSFIQWNENYHAEHHRFPALPAFAMPAVHAAGQPLGEIWAGGYIRFHANLLWRSS